MPQKTRQPAKGCETLFIRSIPSEIKSRFKAWCASKHMTMSEALIMLMDDASEPQKQQIMHPLKGMQGIHHAKSRNH